MCLCVSIYTYISVHIYTYVSGHETSLIYFCFPDKEKFARYSSRSYESSAQKICQHKVRAKKKSFKVTMGLLFICLHYYHQFIVICSLTFFINCLIL